MVLVDVLIDLPQLLCVLDARRLLAQLRRDLFVLRLGQDHRRPGAIDVIGAVNRFEREYGLDVVRGLSLAPFDVRALLDSSADYGDVAQSVDSVISAIDLLARGARTSRDGTSSDERDTDADTRTKRLTHRESTIHTPRVRSRLWTPQQRESVRQHNDLSAPVRLFLWSTRVDEKHRNDLVKHLWALRQSGIIRTWDERNIEAGQVYRDEIWRNIRLAELIILLVSVDFLNDLDERELGLISERIRTGSVIPVLVRATDIKTTFVEQLQTLPRGGGVLSKWADADEYWVNVVNGIREAVESIRIASRQFRN